jgi:DNA-binding transcriptional LysR family regulator
MNLQQLRYLVAVADRGTMTAAAAERHVAQPALSRSMKALEGELRVRLFEPSGRNVRLTAVGEEVVAAARIVLADLDRLVAVARAHAEVADVLVVATTPTLEPLFTRHFLPTYLAGDPDRTARIRRAGGREEVVSLVRGEEAMVGLTDLDAVDGLEVVPLGEFEVVLLSPATSTLADRIELTALDRLPLILPSTGSTRRAEFDALFAGLGIEPVVALESDERGSWLEGVLAGIGSVLWYGERATNALERGARVSHFDPPLRRQVGLVHAPGERRPEVTALLDVARAIGLPEWALT